MNSRSLADRPFPERGEPITLPDGAVVGRLHYGTATFPVRRSKHFFRKVGGYSLDASVLEAIKSRAYWVRFWDKELRQALRVRLTDFLANAQRLDYGHGLKLCAPESCYERPGSNAPVAQPPLFA